MHISHLSLTNFRNYGRLELAMPGGPILFYGDNAQGKTNLLEAIYYLATTRSPHAGQDVQLINWDAGETGDPLAVGRLAATIITGGEERRVEMRLIKEEKGAQSSFRREALVNRRKVRLMDLLGNLRVVLFLPEDVQMITGSPAGRRRYLDITLCQTDSVYCRTLSAYNKVLEQRNALLRRMAENGHGYDLLPIYSEKLIHLGSQIFLRRARFLAQLAHEAQRIHYEELTDRSETLRLHYLPRLQLNSFSRGDEQALAEAAQNAAWLQQDSLTLEAVQKRFEQALLDAQEQETLRGATSVGPHRDDWHFQVNGRNLGSYGSRGQQRSAILSLKLAEIEWMAKQTGEPPVLLLDEVVAELDERRRRLLLNSVENVAQAILTATDPGMFSDAFLAKATTIQVKAGYLYSQKELDKS